MHIRKLLFLIFIIFFYQNFAFPALKLFSIFKNNSSSGSIITRQINYQENFEEGHTNGWESYPPSQDTGFDPNFYCEKIDGPNSSKYSLMLKYPASFETEYEMGFIKKTSLIASDNLNVSFYYKADGYGDFSSMNVVLYGADKKQYSFSLPVKDDGKWNQVKIARQNFKNSGHSINSLTKIDGFSVEAHISKTNPDIVYKLYFDNLNISALKEAEFQIEIPKSEYLENMDMIIPLHHYSAGEEFNLSAKIINNIKLESVKINLSDPKNNHVLKNINLKYNEGKKTWNGENLYEFSDKNIPGEWKVELIGNDNSGKKIKTDFKIWLTEKKSPHPKMYFANDRLNYYKEKIKDKHWKVWWDSLIVKAERTRKSSNLGSITFGVPNSSITETNPIKLSLESLRNVDLSVYDTIYLLPTLRHYFNIMVGAMNQLQENSLIYALTGDTAAGNYAKEALIIISGWKTWTHPWFNARHRETYYPVGELGVRAAFCYDVVYDLMNDEERKKISEGLLKNCIIPAYKEYVLEDRIPSATSNWVGNTVSGGIQCALAIYGDNPKLGSLEPYVSGLIKKLEDHINFTLDTTGAWGEGISYQAFSYSNVLPTLSVIKNVLNLDLSNQNIFDSYRYFLYNFSDPVVFDVGDSHAGESTLSNFAWISSNTNDPIFNWFYQKSPKENVLDFLFGKDDVKVKSPEGILPASALFKEIGGVVFRSGWSGDDILLNFRSGAFYNHQHFDQGSFQLRAFGETLVPEAGWANYYNDPWYPRYYIQPAGHSTLLLDEDAGSQRSGDYNNFFIPSANKHAKTTDFITTDFYSAATGEISDVYRGKLDQFERNIIFLNKKYFVIFDKIKSSKDPHEYDLLFHFEDSKDVSLKENTFIFKMDKASLYSQVLFPEKIKMKIVEAPINLDVPIKKPGYVQISNLNKSIEENFLTILYPEKGNKLTDFSKNIIKLNSDNFIGFSLEENDQKDILLFKTGNKNIVTSKVLTDGKIAEVTLKNNKLLSFAARDAANFVYDGNKLIEINIPATFAAKLSKEKDEWKINSDKKDEAKINLSSKPEKIILNGEEINEEQFKIESAEDGEKLIIPISTGKNYIKIEY